jgi:polyisoprenoid-binding protein YceI
MRMKAVIIFALLFLTTSFTILVFRNWQIDPGYSIRFDGKYAHGTFSKLGGTIHFDPADLPAARFDVTVDVNSIDTGIELKNKHAKSDKWFDTEKFPVIRFVSSEVGKYDSAYVVRGTLDMHGFKQEIAIPFTFSQVEKGAVFSGKFKVNRGDFGIGKTNGKESDSTTVEVTVPVF